MSSNAPGKAHREGISLIQLFEMFPDDDAARAWFEGLRWRNGVFCPRCGSTAVVEVTPPTMSHRCRDCRRAGGKARFSVRIGTAMEASSLGYKVWAIAIYLHATRLKACRA